MIVLRSNTLDDRVDLLESVLHARDILVNSDDDYWGSSSWVWGRWILFVIFLVFLVASLFLTGRVNRRRRMMGQAPIRGTAWLTPPSYRQSERDYNATTSGTVEDYVPKYTETSNADDLGYYDERGEFHANDKAEYLPPPTLTFEVDSDENSQGLERPGRALTRQPSNFMPDQDMDLDFRRYTYLNNNHTNNTSTNANTPNTTGNVNNTNSENAESSSTIETTVYHEDDQVNKSSKS
ncbi:hypothetical protein Kpol_1045p63 [Vanderwaltozyma polyspora DSM 70294]|uniref:Protein RCR2 n=1 Tax=Vanderwaltozyma polyspora (strain ATCC 22028 / DSM 70294 / BCRC 21397 / CBS 2163 / NBRC 10782 / NRRL Y-8283 / UCD 57-17) TaxID=436907 RepID=A7TI69_VANPO|nr:uncharacterized protein Kpol_1045p63 [Vanderwaltozyma polyspora DSM 70294]EDO18076.1 hypothetical protein Kpol_1045p63 [Vanderwaltozyma polyspora DSM 70294]